jgi:hypothetical protein
MKKELVTKYIKWLLGCSLVAALLNPMSWLFIISPLSLLTSPLELLFAVCLCLFYIVPYLAIGGPVWYSLRARNWKLQAFAIWLSVNAVIAVLTILYLRFAFTSVTGPNCVSPLSALFPIFVAISCVLSIIPISYCCRNFKTTAEAKEKQRNAKC